MLTSPGRQAAGRSKRVLGPWWLAGSGRAAEVSALGAPADQPLLRRNERRFLAGP